MRQYWPIRKELAITNGIVMKGKRRNNTFSVIKEDTVAAA